MTAEINNSECNAQGDTGASTNQTAWILRDHTKWMAIENSNSDHDVFPVNDEFREGFKAAWDLVNDPSKLERFKDFCAAESKGKEAFDFVMNITAEWVRQRDRIITAYMLPRPGGLFFEFITPGFEYDDKIAEEISELCLKIHKSYPDTSVVIDSIAAEVFDRPISPESLD